MTTSLASYVLLDGWFLEKKGKTLSRSRVSIDACLQ